MSYLLDEIYQKITELELYQCDLPGSRWMKIMQQQEVEFPLKIEISLTKKCNQNCIHCSNGGSGSDKVFEISYIDIVLQMQPGYVVLTGGEPLLHPELINVIKKIKQTNAFLKICTNGSLLGQLNNVKKLAELLDDRDIIQISFDAADEQTYALLRGKNHFKRVVEGINNIKKQYNWLKFELHCVPTAGNISQIVDIYKLACALKVDFFSIAPLAPLGKALNSKMVDVEQLLYVHYNLLCLSLEGRTKYIGRPYEIASLYGKISNDNAKSEKEYTCAAGYESLYIDNDGTVFPCVYMQHSNFKLGNISQGCRAILNSVRDIMPRNYSLDKSPCGACYLWGKCHGGCIGLAFDKSGKCMPGYDPRCAVICS